MLFKQCLQTNSSFKHGAWLSMAINLREAGAPGLSPASPGVPGKARSALRRLPKGGQPLGRQRDGGKRGATFSYTSHLLKPLLLSHLSATQPPTWPRREHHKGHGFGASSQCLHVRGCWEPTSSPCTGEHWTNTPAGSIICRTDNYY